MPPETGSLVEPDKASGILLWYIGCLIQTTGNLLWRYSAFVPLWKKLPEGWKAMPTIRRIEHGACRSARRLESGASIIGSY